MIRKTLIIKYFLFKTRGIVGLLKGEGATDTLVAGLESFPAMALFASTRVAGRKVPLSN
jgi:hypothetical protein